MKALYKKFYELNEKNFNDLFERRKTSETAVITNLKIKPMNQREIYQLYFIPTLKMLELCNEIYGTDKYLQILFDDLPEIAKKKYMLECIVEELQNTNEIEGVRSSREEIVRSAKALKEDVTSKKRFTSMIHSYMKLMSGELTAVKDVEDVRKIYDYLLEREIPDEDLPDGEIFRKDKCVVLKYTGSQKEIHEGLYPEKKIHEGLTEMLQFLNEEDNIPLIIKVIIGHYYFGYIHPFYDGNGRTSRFISSLYLQQEYTRITSISLSRGCNINVIKYLKLFENANKFSNRGEMNEFIEGMLEIIYSTQIIMIEEIKEKRSLLDNAYEIINGEKAKDKTEIEKNILFILAQDILFASVPGLTVKEFSNILEASEQTVRKVMNKLADEDFIEFTGQKPKVYRLNRDFIEK